MSEAFHELAHILSIILICIGGFSAGLAILIFSFKIVGQAAFGDKFDDWWYSKFPF